MKTVLSAKLAGYGMLSGLGLFVGLASHDLEITLLGVPFALGLIAGLVAVQRPELSVSAELSAERVLEGDEVELRWRIETPQPVGHLELTATLPPALEPVTSRDLFASLELENAGSTGAIERLRTTRWGRWAITDLAWRVLDPGRFVSYEAVSQSALVVQVHPTPEHLKEIVDPTHTSVATGSHTSRATGEGIEFAEVRPFTPGERVRRVNWRATARHGGELWINRQHLERNADVVLLVDSLTDDALTLEVRVALRLVMAYARCRDRIGVISFGGQLRWVEPGAGIRHLYRVLDALLLTKTAFSYVWGDPSTVPVRTLPPGALVFAISPLEEERAFATIRELGARGIDLVVIEVAPPGLSVPGHAPTDQLAYRLWSMQRQAQRSELRQLGVPVVVWSDELSLAEVLEEINAFRRRLRRRAG